MTDDRSKSHVDLETARRFGAGELPRPEMFDVAWHLFLCPDCRELLPEAGPEAQAVYRRMFGDGGMAYPLSAYSETVARAAGSLRDLGFSVQADREDARHIVARLLRHPPERRRLLVHERERYRTFSVADALLGACRASWSDDAAAAEELAELALSILDRLDRAKYPADMLNDLRAQAWGAIGNCRRIRCDLRSVYEAFELAESFLRRGTGDPTDEAHLLDLRVSYLIDQHRFDEADIALERLITVYRDAADRHAEGRVLLKLAKLRREQGRTEEAIPFLERAKSALDLTLEPRLELLLQRNLALFLAEVGRASEAQALLPGIRALARERGNRPERVQVLWTEGMIYHRLQHFELAVEALEQARVGFLDLDLDYDAAFVTLDLALVHIDAAQPARARALAEQMLPLFESRALHREARAALAVVRQALEEDAPDRELVGEVAAFLRWSRRNPALPFEPGIHRESGPEG